MHALLNTILTFTLWDKCFVLLHVCDSLCDGFIFVTVTSGWDSHSILLDYVFVFFMYALDSTSHVMAEILRYECRWQLSAYTVVICKTANRNVCM